MTIELNHTIIQAKDAEVSAKFLAEMLGLPSPTSFGPFIVVKTSNDVSLDFRTTTSEIKSRHFAFLVNEQEFDEIFHRITQKQLKYWADPDKLNHSKSIIMMVVVAATSSIQMVIFLKSSPDPTAVLHNSKNYSKTT